MSIIFNPQLTCSFFLKTEGVKLLNFILRRTLAEAFVVPTDSMAPTIHPDDRIWVEKMGFRFTGIKRGDIIVFYPPDSAPHSVLWVKRVIGLPGETVEIKRGSVYINHEPLSEPYIVNKSDYDYSPITLSSHHCFVLGDNRNNSQDSHCWGELPLENIQGRMIFHPWSV